MPVAWMKADMLAYPLQTVTNTINCVGAAGKGLALQFKRKFPANNKDYVELCRRGEVKAGQPYLFKGSTPWILNFPTKRHWKDPSKIEWIETGLAYLSENYKKWGIESLSIPKLGCGLGGLDWNLVKKLMYQELDQLDIITIIHI